jgi:hypothetical protein
MISLRDRLLLPLRILRAWRRGALITQGAAGDPHRVHGFDPRFEEGEAAYNAIGETADGRIVFAVSTKTLHRGARLFSFDPASSLIDVVGDLDTAVAGQALAIPQGKVHVDFARLGAVLYGASHVGYYDPNAREERPGSASGFGPYPGGWFFSVSPEDSWSIRPLAQAPHGDGIITMSLDAPHQTLHALTWPRAHLLSLELLTGTLHDRGPVLGAAETGSRGRGTWTRVCRSLGVDDRGCVYWSDGAGLIHRFDGNAIAPYARIPAAEMWRKVVWHSGERCFYGVTWESSMLFRLDVDRRSCEVVGSLRRAAAPATLAFALDPRGDTIHAFVSGPGLFRKGQLPLAGTVSHARFDLRTHRTSFSGPMQLPDGRWITQAQSLLLHGDVATSLCWVEVPNRDRSPHAERVRALRSHTREFRARGYAEEIQLIRAAID